MSYFNRLQGKLNKQDLQRFVRKRPDKKKFQGHPDGRSGNKKYTKTADAGQIDFYHYGGKKSRETKWEELISGAKYWNKKKGKGDYNQTREDWKKVAKELGISNVNSEKDVLKMIEHVRGGSMAKEQKKPKESEPKPDPVVQNDPNNTRLKEQQQNYLDTRLDNPGNELPSVAQTNNVYADLEGFAKASNDHYQKKFIPSLKAEAIATGAEIGDSSRFHIDNFDFKVPTLELGGIRKSFEWYRDQINKGKD